MYLLIDTVIERKNKVFIINGFTSTSIQYVHFSACNIVLIRSSVGRKRNPQIAHLPWSEMPKELIYKKFGAVKVLKFINKESLQFPKQVFAGTHSLPAAGNLTLLRSPIVWWVFLMFTVCGSSSQPSPRLVSPWSQPTIEQTVINSKTAPILKQFSYC